VREKVLAAYRLKLTTVLLPRQNEKDLVDLPKRARQALSIRLVDHMEDILELALGPAPAPTARPPRKPKKAAPARKPKKAAPVRKPKAAPRRA
jgi:ATP-dependent Lon protease